MVRNQIVERAVLVGILIQIPEIAVVEHREGTKFVVDVVIPFQCIEFAVDGVLLLNPLIPVGRVEVDHVALIQIQHMTCGNGVWHDVLRHGMVSAKSVPPFDMVVRYCAI